MRNTKSLVGKKFHMLTVLEKVGVSRQGSTTWRCRCDCGNEVVYSKDHLTRKKQPVKSCSCLYKTKHGANHPQWTGHGDISGGWWHNHVTRERTQTSRPKIPVTITIECAWELYLAQDKKCALSGIPIIISQTAKHNTASIDRIDNNKGYEPGNIQWVHKHVNFMKRTYVQEYFISMCKLIAEHKAI